jgi:hypothetical protein
MSVQKHDTLNSSNTVQEQHIHYTYFVYKRNALTTRSVLVKTSRLILTVARRCQTSKQTQKNKLGGFIPQANYTDRATAAFRWS